MGASTRTLGSAPAIPAAFGQRRAITMQLVNGGRNGESCDQVANDTTDEGLLALVDPTNPQTWPAETLVLRGGNEDAETLARKREVGGFGGWSVQSAPMVDERDLAYFLQNNRYRTATLASLRAVEGLLAYAPDGELIYHCDAHSMEAEVFDVALGPARDNPVPRKDRYKG